MIDNYPTIAWDKGASAGLSVGHSLQGAAGPETGSGAACVANPND
jgi:hypothetical protein